MGFYEDFLRQGVNYDPNKGVEYYEDTHDATGNYRANARRNAPPPAPSNTDQRPPRVRENSYQASQQPTPPLDVPIPGLKPSLGARPYQNFVMYAPRNASDVESLINFLKQREPAIVDLDRVVDHDAQRILDFLSGAMFALNGTIRPVAKNIFLLSPEGVAVNASIEDDDSSAS